MYIKTKLCNSNSIIVISDSDRIKMEAKRTKTNKTIFVFLMCLCFLLFKKISQIIIIKSRRKNKETLLESSRVMIGILGLLERRVEGVRTAKNKV